MHSYLNWGFEPTFGNNIRLCKELPYDFDSDENNTFIQRINKLGFDAETDDDVFECPTKHFFNTRVIDLQYFIHNNYKDLLKLFKEVGFKPSSCYKNIENEGGGHIHLSQDRLFEQSEKFQNLFRYNMIVFCANFPELNYLMNNPHDNYNANRFLVNRKVYNRNFKTGRAFYSKPRISALKQLKFGCLYGFNNKCFPIIFRQNTIEFRLFIMPRTLNELKFHFNIAFSIYEMIWNTTLNNKRIINLKRKVTTFKESCKFSKEMFKLIKLNKEEILFIEKFKMPFMKFRFEHDEYWSKELHTNPFDYEESFEEIKLLC